MEPPSRCCTALLPAPNEKISLHALVTLYEEKLAGRGLGALECLTVHAVSYYKEKDSAAHECLVAHVSHRHGFPGDTNHVAFERGREVPSWRSAAAEDGPRVFVSQREGELPEDELVFRFKLEEARPLALYQLAFLGLALGAYEREYRSAGRSATGQDWFCQSLANFLVDRLDGQITYGRRESSDNRLKFLTPISERLLVDILRDRYLQLVDAFYDKVAGEREGLRCKALERRRQEDDVPRTRTIESTKLRDYADRRFDMIDERLNGIDARLNSLDAVEGRTADSCGVQ